MSSARAQEARPELLAGVRRSVRALLEETPAFREATPAEQQAIASRLVSVGMIAARMVDDDHRLTEVAARHRTKVLARAQEAGEHLGMQAVRGAADVLRRTREAIDFPAFVGSLITGTFQAILSSTTAQLGSLSEMLDAVSASAEEFEGTLTDAEVMQYALAKFSSFLEPSDDGLRVREGVALEDYGPAIVAGIGASEDEVAGLDAAELGSTLLPLVRRKMGRDKQSILATMVSMGVQRIVVDEGRLHASMDLRVDASSAAQQDVAERSDWRVNAGAAGSFGYGPWSASASASTSVGKVHSDHQYTAEQIGVRAGLRSSVELAFRTEQVPLDRLADQHQRVRIGQNARVPIDVSGSEGGLPDIRSGFTSTSIEVAPPPAAPTPLIPPDVFAAGQRSLPGQPEPPGAPNVAQPGAPNVMQPGAPNVAQPGAPNVAQPGAPNVAAQGGARTAAPASRVAQPAGPQLDNTAQPASQPNGARPALAYGFRVRR